MRSALCRRLFHTVLHHTRPQPSANEAQHAPVANPVLDEPHHPVMADVVEEPLDVSVQYPVHRPVPNPDRKRVQCIVLSPSRSEPVGEANKVLLVDRIENLHHSALDNLVFQRCDPQRPLPTPIFAHRAGLSRRDVSGRRREDRALFFEKGTPTRKVWYYQLDPGRSLGKTNALNDDDLKEFVVLQARLAESEKSWTVEVSDVDRTSCDLSVKNPNEAEEDALRDPQDIIAEIMALDLETTGILKSIRGML